jgi:hypothetical protein
MGTPLTASPPLAVHTLGDGPNNPSPQPCSTATRDRSTDPARRFADASADALLRLVLYASQRADTSLLGTVRIRKPKDEAAN